MDDVLSKGFLLQSLGELKESKKRILFILLKNIVKGNFQTGCVKYLKFKTELV